jgi:hypothetical protein
MCERPILAVFLAIKASLPVVAASLYVVRLTLHALLQRSIAALHDVSSSTLCWLQMQQDGEISGGAEVALVGFPYPRVAMFLLPHGSMTHAISFIIQATGRADGQWRIPWESTR